MPLSSCDLFGLVFRRWPAAPKTDGVAVGIGKAEAVAAVRYVSHIAEGYLFILKMPVYLMNFVYLQLDYGLQIPLRIRKFQARYVFRLHQAESDVQKKRDLKKYLS